MAGFEVTPPSPSSTTRRLSSPPAIRLRRMKSSQTDCPYCRNDATGFWTVEEVLGVPIPSSPCQLCLRGGHHVARVEAELLLQVLEGGRGAEGPHADDPAGEARVAVPAEGRALLDADPGGDRGGKDAVLVLPRLAVEQLPGWHADDTAPDAVGRELLVGGQAERDLAARGEEQDFGRAAGGVREDIGSLGEARGGPVLRPVDGGEGLTGQDQAHGLVAEL